MKWKIFYLSFEWRLLPPLQLSSSPSQFFLCVLWLRFQLFVYFVQCTKFVKCLTLYFENKRKHAILPFGHLIHLKREREILGGVVVRLEKMQKFSVCNCNEPKTTQITLFNWDSKTWKNKIKKSGRPTGIKTKIFILDNYWIGLM